MDPITEMWNEKINKKKSSYKVQRLRIKKSHNLKAGPFSFQLIISQIIVLRLNVIANESGYGTQKHEIYTLVW